MIIFLFFIWCCFATTGYQIIHVPGISFFFNVSNRLLGSWKYVGEIDYSFIFLGFLMATIIRITPKISGVNK